MALVEAISTQAAEREATVADVVGSAVAVVGVVGEVPEDIQRKPS